MLFRLMARLGCPCGYLDSAKICRSIASDCSGACGAGAASEIARASAPIVMEVKEPTFPVLSTVLKINLVQSTGKQ